MILWNSIGIFASLLTIIVILICLLFVFYFYYRFKPAEDLQKNIFNLQNEKIQLVSEIESCKKWLEDHRDELLTKEDEIKYLEKIRRELENTQINIAKEEDHLRKCQNDILVSERERQELLSDQNRNKDSIQSLEEELNSLKDSKESMVNELKTTTESLKENYDKIQLQQNHIEVMLEKESAITLSIQEKEDFLTDIESQINKKSTEQNELEKSIQELLADESKIKKELEIIESRHQSQVAKLEDIRSEVMNIKSELTTLNISLNEKKSELEFVGQKLNEKQKNLDSFDESKIIDYKDKLDKVETAVNEKQIEFQSLLTKNQELKYETGELETRVTLLQEKENELRSNSQRDSNTSSEDPYQSLYQKPAFFNDYSSPHKQQFSEENALADLKDSLKKSKLIFHDRVINSFHTSLKIVDINPLLVMAGISGTGKSELPRRYAEAMGIHFLLLPVQPRWDSPQDMFGFYNYLEHQYKPTELSQALVFMDKWNHPDRAKFSDRLLIVLLDEMNLARPEYYFSEFLSRLETRRSVNPSIDKERRKAEIGLDIGKYGEGIDIPHLYVHNNVMFIGTMNEDESTQTLSDKVIDRANVIRFNRPKKMSPDIPKGGENKSNNYLPLSVWNSWRYKSYNDIDPGIGNKVEKWISKINDSLADIGRPFGYRINQTIFTYLANYPEAGSKDNYLYAFGDQLEQKIIPKLRGLDLEENSDCFETIKDVIEKLNDNELFDAFEKATDKNRYMFTWHGVSRNHTNG
ncbi:MAG: AAA family ATPase [Desulfamplus sp.]|nr:AAA family ATPase [Desulfamplus sp.]